jgi:hypothetical protein
LHLTQTARSGTQVNTAYLRHGNRERRRSRKLRTEERKVNLESLFINA